MRACVLYGPGDMQIVDVERRDPGAGEVEVSVALGGICGSDLHYYHDGVVGDYRLQEPMVLGHEVVGTVSAVGETGDSKLLGARVAVHPASPCGSCEQCHLGRRNLCRRSRYLGSAAHNPHVQGAFVQSLVVGATQVRPLSPDLPMERAILAEPLSVALHAVQRAGDIWDKRVLVTGAGPIGCLVVAVLRHAGAAEIIVSDLYAEALAVATKVGATSVELADQFDADGRPSEVDIAIEASGSPIALDRCVRQVRPGGTVVLLGLASGSPALASNLVVTREISLRGAFRFDHEFDDALALLAGGLDVGPVITHQFSLAEAHEAFRVAGDRRSASKVLLDLDGPGT